MELLDADLEDIREALGKETLTLRETAVAYGWGFDDDMEYQIDQGLPITMMEELMERYALSAAEMAHALRIPMRTFARRKNEARLQADESDNFLRLARVLGRTSRVLGGHGPAGQWFHRQNRALGGRSPLSMADSDLGNRRVEATLGRIEHGVFS